MLCKISVFRKEPAVTIMPKRLMKFWAFLCCPIFSKTADVDALLANACQYKGVKYAGTDGSVLNTPCTAWLNVETRDKMANVSKRLVSKMLGFNGDESMDNFYMRKDGKVSRQTYKQIVATMIARQKTQGR